RINGYTRLAAVVANPIKHSISPFIHNAAFDLTAVNGVYVAWEILSKDLEETVENIRRYNMFGINLSMPYKQKVIPFLDELSPEAKLIGAVSTVAYKNGRLIGYNMDGKGFFKSLTNFSVKNKSMTILGSGGAATAIVAQAALDGAASIYVFGRSSSLNQTREKFEEIAEKTGVPIIICSLRDSALLQKMVESSALFINATSVGMDGTSLIVPSNFVFPKEILVADVIYQPFETPFLKLAKSQGATAVNGLGMLVYQAAEVFELWTGKAMPVELIWKELEKQYR
ncbi:shikimate dehydrogenase, partial [Streptococcus massiliensis]